MKYVIIIDSVAAVSNYFLNNRPFEVMPVSVKVDGELVPDSFDRRELICQTISKKVSVTFDNFQLAANGISKGAREVRDALNIEHSFHMNCINTGSTIAGSGLIAIYADVILSKGTSYNDYISVMQKFTRMVHCYGVVPDVLYSRARAMDKGIKSLSFPAALFGKTVGLNPIVRITYDHQTKPVLMKRGMENAIDSLLNYATERVKEGLYTPIVNLSYAGDPSELEALKSFQRLLSNAKKRKINVLVGVMSLAAGVVFGPGALTMGIAPKDQKAVPK